VTVGPDSLPWRAAALGAKAVSVRLSRDTDLSELLGTFVAQGYETQGVITRALFSDPDVWRWHLGDDLDDTVGRHLDAGLLGSVVIGHEPDDGYRHGYSDNPEVIPRGGVGSWVLSLDELAELVYRVGDWALGTRTPVPLYLGGISHPEYLAQVSLDGLSGVLVHPYGFGPDPDWSGSAVRRGLVGALLDQVQAVIVGQGKAGLVQVRVGELGISDDEVDRGTAAEWFARMLGVLSARGDVETAYVCCDSDLTLSGYGQFDAHERAKPAVAAIRLAADRISGDAQAQADPEPELPDVPRSPEAALDADDPLPWFDRHFTPEGIRGCLDALAAPSSSELSGPPASHQDIVEVWSDVGPFLGTFGVEDSVPVKIAVLATLAVQTNYTLRLTDGDRLPSYDRYERRYGAAVDLGQHLGNRYPGDGMRYRPRGRLPIAGRRAYELYAGLLDVPLLSDPDEALDPTIAAGLLVTHLATQDVFPAADRGDWTQVRRASDPGLNGFAPFMRAVQAFSDLAIHAPAAATPPAAEATLGAVFAAASGRVGDQYRQDGSTPGRFDALGLVVWAYETAAGISLPRYSDALLRETVPVAAASASAGDLIFYAYLDPDAPDLRCPHLGLVTERADLVLDARASGGVGYHAHLSGAVRHYRRVRALAEQPGEDDEAMWKQKYDDLLLELGGKVGAALQALDDVEDVPELPSSKATKAEWVETAQALARWAHDRRTLTQAQIRTLEAFGRRVITLAEEAEAREEGEVTRDAAE